MLVAVTAWSFYTVYKTFAPSRLPMNAKLLGNSADLIVFGHGAVDLDGWEVGPFGLVPEAIGEYPYTENIAMK